MTRADQIRVEMAALVDQIEASLESTPEDFDGREPLWMRRETLRDELWTLDTGRRYAA